MSVVMVVESWELMSEGVSVEVVVNQDLESGLWCLWMRKGCPASRIHCPAGSRLEVITRGRAEEARNYESIGLSADFGLASDLSLLDMTTPIATPPMIRAI